MKKLLSTLLFFSLVNAIDQGNSGANSQNWIKTHPRLMATLAVSAYFSTNGKLQQFLNKNPLCSALFGSYCLTKGMSNEDIDFWEPIFLGLIMGVDLSPFYNVR